MNDQQSVIYNALTKLDYAIEQLENALDAQQEAKALQADMFQTAQTKQEQTIQQQVEEQLKTYKLDKKNIVKTLERSIQTIETVLKKAS